jgi:hypothetical protein
MSLSDVGVDNKIDYSDDLLSATVSLNIS